MNPTETLFAALERLDATLPKTIRAAKYVGFDRSGEVGAVHDYNALRNALPALVELVKHYKAAVEFLGYTGEADEDAARVLAALGGGDE